MGTATPDEPDADYIGLLWGAIETLKMSEEKSAEAFETVVKILSDREKSGDTIKQLMGYVSGDRRTVAVALLRGRFKGTTAAHVDDQIDAAMRST